MTIAHKKNASCRDVSLEDIYWRKNKRIKWIDWNLTDIRKDNGFSYDRKKVLAVILAMYGVKGMRGFMREDWEQIKALPFGYKKMLFKVLTDDGYDDAQMLADIRALQSDTPQMTLAITKEREPEAASRKLYANLVHVLKEFHDKAGYPIVDAMQLDKDNPPVINTEAKQITETPYPPLLVRNLHEGDVIRIRTEEVGLIALRVTAIVPPEVHLQDCDVVIARYSLPIESSIRVNESLVLQSMDGYQITRLITAIEIRAEGERSLALHSQREPATTSEYGVEAFESGPSKQLQTLLRCLAKVLDYHEINESLESHFDRMRDAIGVLYFLAKIPPLDKGFDPLWRAEENSQEWAKRCHEGFRIILQNMTMVMREVPEYQHLAEGIEKMLAQVEAHDIALLDEELYEVLESPNYESRSMGQYAVLCEFLATLSTAGWPISSPLADRERRLPAASEYGSERAIPKHAQEIAEFCAEVTTLQTIGEGGLDMEKVKAELVELYVACRLYPYERGKDPDDIIFAVQEEWMAEESLGEWLLRFKTAVQKHLESFLESLQHVPAYEPIAAVVRKTLESWE